MPGLRRAIVKEFEAIAGAAITTRGQFVVALPGGSVAKHFFPSLAGAAIDWSRVHFFWIDERAVPPGDPESNYALASALWLTPAGVPAAQVHRLHGEDPDLERAAAKTAADLIAIAGNPPRLDVALAGVGEDGHVASIFPHVSTSASALIAPIYDAPKPPPRRLTLTMPVLSNAGRVIVAALGRSKAVVVTDALRTTDSKTPLAELLRRSQSSLVLLDPEAAGNLRSHW